MAVYLCILILVAQKAEGLICPMIYPEVPSVPVAFCQRRLDTTAMVSEIDRHLPQAKISAWMTSHQSLAHTQG